MIPIHSCTYTHSWITVLFIYYLYSEYNSSYAIIICIYIYIVEWYQIYCGGHDRMVVGYTTTYAINVYHHWCCEFEYQLGRGVQHYVIKFVSDLRQFGGFLRVLQFLPPINLTAKIYWNIVESGVKYHQQINRFIVYERE